MDQLEKGSLIYWEIKLCMQQKEKLLRHDSICFLGKERFKSLKGMFGHFGKYTYWCLVSCLDLDTLLCLYGKYEAQASKV